MPAPSTPAGAGAGGGGSSTFSPSAGGRKGSTVLYPFTVRHLAMTYKEAGGDSLVVNGQEIQSVVLVGKVGPLETRTTDMTFILDDGTGKLEIRKWHDDQEQETEKLNEIQTGKYVKVHGVPRKLGSKYSLSANSIRAITDFDEYTCHYLDCIFAYQYSKSQQGGQPGLGSTPPKAASGQQGSAAYTGANQGHPHSAMPGVASSAASDSRLPVHERVLKYFADTEGTDPAGVHRDQACRSIPGISPQQVMETIEFLVSEGHLYSTIDDVHFKTLGENQ